MQDSLEGLEAALFLALVVLDRAGLTARFRSILDNAATECRRYADEETGDAREALEALADSLERASRRVAFEVNDGGKAD